MHKLGERVKELTALHRTARLLQDNHRSATTVINELVASLRSAWQFPEITAVRIRFLHVDCATNNYAYSPWVQTAEFAIPTGETGMIEVRYLEARPAEVDGPFLAEERELIESIAEMLRSYFQHRLADEALRNAHDELERQVRDRTVDLRATNKALQEQLREQERAQRQITAYQEQLRQLNSELSLAEERERRAIAADLHDHIGQSLAFIRMRVSEFRTDKAFSDYEQNIQEILSLLDKTIQYTRNLTFEISPPILYELGLEAAIEWLAEQFEQKHGFSAQVASHTNGTVLAEEVQVVLFKCIHELLTNVAKHACADQVTISLSGNDGHFSVSVADNGIGFDTRHLDTGAHDSKAFGLFSVKERMRFLDGKFQIESRKGRGTTVTIGVPV